MIGFVGLGRMGHPMALNLVNAGHDVVAVDTYAPAAERARVAGIDASTDLATLAGAEVVCSSLPDTAEVEEVYVGTLFDVLDAGAVCADLSTIAVEGSRRIAGAGADKGIAFLDTPVSGTIPHAEAATLAIMVGGDADALTRARPVLDVLSSSVHHFGPNGAGLIMKLITNRLLSACTAAIAEATLSMEANGLDTGEGFDFLGNSAVPKLIDYKGPALRNRDFSPTFTVGLMRKDLRHAEGLAGPDRMAKLVHAIFDEAGALGHNDADIAAIIETWQG
jgi:3-hydroxyisobutyrate dehydrogenase-like beta-hydroxyacid dehydrogenase